jgi:hypothetical protein
MAGTLRPSLRATFSTDTPEVSIFLILATREGVHEFRDLREVAFLAAGLPLRDPRAFFSTGVAKPFALLELILFTWRSSRFTVRIKALRVLARRVLAVIIWANSAVDSRSLIDAGRAT